MELRHPQELVATIEAVQQVEILLPVLEPREGVQEVISLQVELHQEAATIVDHLVAQEVAEVIEAQEAVLPETLEAIEVPVAVPLEVQAAIEALEAALPEVLGALGLPHQDHHLAVVEEGKSHIIL